MSPYVGQMFNARNVHELKIVFSQIESSKKKVLRKIKMERTFIFKPERENWNFWDTDEERRPRGFNTYMSYWRQEKSGMMTAINLLNEFEWMNSRSRTNKESEREKK